MKDVRKIDEFMGAKQIVDEFFDTLDVILKDNPKTNMGIKAPKRLTFTENRV